MPETNDPAAEVAALRAQLAEAQELAERRLVLLRRAGAQDVPPVPVPPPYQPPPGTTARHGRSEPPSVYLRMGGNPRGVCIGRLDTAEYAALVVAALNTHLAGELSYEYGVRITWPDGRSEDTWRGPRMVAEQGLSGWGEATARLIRRRVVRSPAEEVGESGGDT